MRKRVLNSLRKSSPRLPEFSYRGYYCYFITCCTYKGVEFFKDDKIVKEIENILQETAKGKSYLIYCFCFMPDHLHLLIGGENENCILKDFMRIFKQKSSFAIKKMTGKKLWQRSYYDHVVRKAESLKETCEYILENPVRKGLVENYQEYPYSFSLIEDFVGQT